MVEKLRENRANSERSTIVPTTGNRVLARSHCMAPDSVKGALDQKTKAKYHPPRYTTDE